MNQRLFLTIAALFFFAIATVRAQEYTPPGTEEQYQKQYAERIRKDRLNGVYIPKNLDDACRQLSALSSPESRERFKKLPEDSVSMYMHRSLGQWMIVNWSFYEGSRLSHYLRSAGVTYPDDMADFLIVAWHQQLNGQPIEIKALVQRFKEKRKKLWEAEKQEKLQTGEVINEETRKKTPPAKPSSGQ